MHSVINELLENGIIRQSESPYASPVVMVLKKNGEYRKCVDYRALNKITVRDNFPLPLIETCMEYLGGNRYFSTLDLKNGFFHVKLDEDSKKYTSFVTPDGQYEYNCMPFGLKNAPAVFQRYIHCVLRDFIESGKIIVYLDDISIATRDFETHCILLSEVLQRLSSLGLELNLKNAVLLMKPLTI